MVAKALHQFSYKGTSYKAGDYLDVAGNELPRLENDVEIVEETKKEKPKRKQVKKIYKK
jgi:hypothetical protein